MGSGTGNRLFALDRDEDTPGGVGLAMQPPQWLKAGDKVRVEIDRIGSIEAEIRPERGS